MKFYCKECQRFIADIKRFNYMELKGKSYDITKYSIKLYSIKLKCKCGVENIIKLQNVGRVCDTKKYKA